MKESESLKTNNRVTDKDWKNFDPWEFCGQDYYCKRAPRDKGGCMNGCIVPKLYRKLAEIEDREENAHSNFEEEEEYYYDDFGDEHSIWDYNDRPVYLKETRDYWHQAAQKGV